MPRSHRSVFSAASASFWAIAAAGGCFKMRLLWAGWSGNFQCFRTGPPGSKVRTESWQPERQ